jgi:hypothetical protein
MEEIIYLASYIDLAIILIIFYGKINVLLLWDELPQEIIPYCITEWK